MPPVDLSEALQAQVQAALARNTALAIVGGGSKVFYGLPSLSGARLELGGHTGIVEYQPTELVVTARAGMPLAELEAALHAQGQMLGFEPPHFGPNATVGGMVACGLSGPRRPYAGAVRDAVLGVKLLNGRAEILSFGGQVMKNVAGFDVSRLQAGALGTLGVLLDVSLKVLPRPEAEETLVFEMATDEAITAMNRWAGQPWPLSAACFDGFRLYLRLSGAEAAIRASHKQLGGERLESSAAFWADLKEQRLPFFDQPGSLWRLSIPPAAPLLPGDCLIDWGGALRWLKTSAPAESVFAAARELGGHATLFRRGEEPKARFQDLPTGLKALHIKLKHAFDPQGLFNPGRLHQDW